MATVSGFDTAAAVYDASFTQTEIGKMQRKRVYAYLEPYLNTTTSLNILELNCGTGEDALFMANKGHSILATDVSSVMLNTAKAKSNNHPNIEFQLLNINNLDELAVSEKFDLIFSNFGGLNCISPKEFQEFFTNASGKLKRGGQFIAVIMPKKCLWERFYYLLKASPSKAHRRNTNGGIKVEVGESEILTWYYDPKETATFAGKSFRRRLIKPIGFLIPPSYLNAFFKNKKVFLKFLAWLENRIFPFGFLGTYADHYIIILERK
ncbi:MAG: class I SAM-dependent methyltransferase [Flavobacteriaceae bacterium]